MDDNAVGQEKENAEYRFENKDKQTKSENVNLSTYFVRNPFGLLIALAIWFGVIAVDWIMMVLFQYGQDRTIFNILGVLSIVLMALPLFANFVAKKMKLKFKTSLPTLERIVLAKTGDGCLSLDMDGSSKIGRVWIVRHSDGSLGFYPTGRGENIVFPLRARGLVSIKRRMFGRGLFGKEETEKILALVKSANNCSQNWEKFLSKYDDMQVMGLKLKYPVFHLERNASD